MVMRHLIHSLAFVVCCALLPIEAGAEEMVYAIAPVTRIQAGDVIAKADLQRIEISARRLRPDSVTDPDDIVGMQAKRTLLPGRVISSLTVGEPVLVERNKRVHARYAEGGLELSLRVVSAEDGAMGETVRVTNPDTGSVLYATVSGYSQVDIGR
jgi:flagella basal body P-ring formation protein FlgA